MKVAGGQWSVVSDKQHRNLEIPRSICNLQFAITNLQSKLSHPPFLVLYPFRFFLLYAILFLAGCSFSSTPQFELNAEGRDPKSIAPSKRAMVLESLKNLFGTPDEPLAPEGTALRKDLLAVAAGRVYSDDSGNPFGLYRKHCVACHGISGNGAGPNAAALLPYPRDYRRGVFKFTSTAGGGKPAREDLLRTLRSGIPGTAMPSFERLPEGEIEALAEYVKYLSIRGETELYLAQLVIDSDETVDPKNLGDILEDSVKPVAQSWQSAAQRRISPPAPPPTDSPENISASLTRGREIFLSRGAQCFKCHGPEGRGDGELRPLYDDWNKPKKGDSPSRTRELAARFTLPLAELKPRNFTEGIFHGGDRPTDQYYRVSVGIPGTPMPSAGPSPGSQGILSPEDIWNVVNYVRSLGKLPSAK